MHSCQTTAFETSVLIFLCLGLYFVHQTTQISHIFGCQGSNYGPNCSLSCYEHCQSESNCTTNQTGGGCADSCGKGYQGFPMCDKPCNDGWWYLNCSRQCHCMDVTDVCDRKNGICFSGCHPDWIGYGCSERLPVLTEPPQIAGANCSHMLVTFRAFNSTLDIGVDSVGFYAVETASAGNANSLNESSWSRQGDVRTSGPYELWIPGNFTLPMWYSARIRVQYEKDFVTTLGAPSNQSVPKQLLCLTTQTDQQSSTVNSTSSPSPVTQRPSDSKALIVTLSVLLFLSACVALAVLLYYWFWIRIRGLKPPSPSSPTMLPLGDRKLAEPRTAAHWSDISALEKPRRPLLDDVALRRSTTTTTEDPVVTFQGEFDALKRLPVVQTSDGPNARPASWCGAVVKGYVRRDAYIVARSPASAQEAGQLWHTVFEENVAQVVDFGDQLSTAFQYCPDEPGSEATSAVFGDVRVRCVARQRHLEFLQRRLLVNGLRVTHYQLLTGIDDTQAFVALYMSVRAAARIQDGPMLLHCRTGTGPSCLFASLDWLLQQAAHEGGALSGYACVRRLRRCLPGALPHDHQFALLYDTAFEAQLRGGFPVVPGGGTTEAFLAAVEAPMTDGSSPLDRQLRLLIRFGPVLDSGRPPDETDAGETVLSVEAPDTGSAALNAFWLGVLRQRIAVVACLDADDGNVAAAVFPPSATTLELPDLRVVAETTEVADGGPRGLNLVPNAVTDGLEPRRVDLVRLAAGIMSFDDASSASVDRLADAVSRLAGLLGDTVETQAMLVSARGRRDPRRCGLLAVTLRAAHHLAADGCADVAGAVRRLHRRHPNAAPTATQYLAIHRCLARLETRRHQLQLRRPVPRPRRRTPKRPDTASILTSTLNGGCDPDRSSIYDYCQMPVKLRPVHDQQSGARPQTAAPPVTEMTPGLDNYCTIEAANGDCDRDAISVYDNCQIPGTLSVYDRQSGAPPAQAAAPPIDDSSTSTRRQRRHPSPTTSEMTTEIDDYYCTIELGN